MSPFRPLTLTLSTFSHTTSLLPCGVGCVDRQREETFAVSVPDLASALRTPPSHSESLEEFISVGCDLCPLSRAQAAAVPISLKLSHGVSCGEVGGEGEGKGGGGEGGGRGGKERNRKKKNKRKKRQKEKLAAAREERKEREGREDVEMEEEGK